MADIARELPHARRFIFLADDPADFFDPTEETSTVVLPSAFAPVTHRHLAFALPPYGLCCVLKPFAAAYLRRIQSTDTLLYLDSDTRVLAPPIEILEATSRHSIVLTPHVIRPDLCAGTDVPTFDSGTFNAGVFALAPTQESDRFLVWWGLQIADPRRAIARFYYDQAWLNLVPGFFDDVGVLRHSGYNVAYWNFHERALTRDLKAGGWQIDGQPLVVYHFSGFKHSSPERLIPQQAGIFFPPDPRWIQIGLDYAELLKAAGADICESWPCQFSRFADGKPVSLLHRQYFIDHLWGILPLEQDPFDPNLSRPSPGLRSLYEADNRLTRLIRAISPKKLLLRPND
jgi:hypothetical protein